MFVTLTYICKISTILNNPNPCLSSCRYDWNIATTFSFLQKYGLTGEFKINVEFNHASLSGHSCHHELETARINGLLGNIDAKTGDPQIGWDTDQFLTDISEATWVMSSVIKNGGLAPGGFNFDAKLLVLIGIGFCFVNGMYTLTNGLRNVAKLMEDGSLDGLVRKRHQSFDSEIGATIEAEKGDLETLEKKISGKQLKELAVMLFQSALYMVHCSCF
ncbi:hypothetical protein GUJ93_ZPchr0013g38017 [Zizania palustris]|uniref:Xylose isomerase n=1 Tax=Zizania palustris TaxID=103762 RepID=A0A8J6C2F8_ZIZPA|nr:hypothetical protein GUJ93_ZPchr0013g38017 [Zizania palustris]